MGNAKPTRSGKKASSSGSKTSVSITQKQNKSKADSPAKRSPLSALSGFPYEYPALLLALGLVMLSLMQFMESQKWLILICCVISLLIAGFALFGKKERNKPCAFLLLYCGFLVWLGLGILWAVSGRFFLREYSKHLLVMPLVLAVFFLLPRKDHVKPFLFDW